MWQMIKKEIRENRRSVPVGWIVFLLALDSAAAGRGWTMLGVWQWVTHAPNSYGVWTGMVRSPVPVEAFGWLCILAAAAIATKQHLVESYCHTWGMLAQLPVGRSRLIFGKVFAGLALYLAILLPPGLFMFARLATPGTWPGPVHLSMVLPLQYHVAAGMACYLVAFLAWIRPARWFGTRWLILLLALFVIGLADNLSQVVGGYPGHPAEWFWQRLTMGAFLAVVAALCLWGIHCQARTREY